METDKEILNKIERVLDRSDIVWPRYGADTIASLAQTILKSIKTEE